MRKTLFFLNLKFFESGKRQIEFHLRRENELTEREKQFDEMASSGFNRKDED